MQTKTTQETSKALTNDQRMRDQQKQIDAGVKQLNDLIGKGFIKRATYRLALSGKAPMRASVGGTQ